MKVDPGKASGRFSRLLWAGTTTARPERLISIIIVGGFTMSRVIPALLLSLIAVTAFAAAPAFDKIDVNKDGALSASEAAAAGISKKMFAGADLDHNQKLNMDEYKALMAQFK